MSYTYDQLTGDPNTFINYTANAGSTSLYPDCNTVAIVGSLYGPRVYGSNLTYFEVASSGKVAITLTDTHTLDFSRSNYVDGTNYMNTIQSLSNYSMQLQANTSALQIQLDAYSNNINITAASNIAISAGSGNMTLTTSNNTILSTSNNFQVEARSNIYLNAVKGAATISAHNSNMFLTMTDSSNTVTLYSSNTMFVSACNNLNINTNSNININTVGGDYNVYTNSSQMFLTMEAATNNTTLFTSNDMFTSASNNYNLNAQSNINIGALGGDYKAYADSSNMYLTMAQATDTMTLYTLSNMFISASNNYNLNAQSNINIGALGGDVKVYSQGSNMYLTMAAATNNVSLFASNNLNISVSNAMNTQSLNAISVATVSGDYRLYVNSSNMFMRMSATTDSINFFSSNNTIFSASNNFNIYALSNYTLATSNGAIAMSANSSNMLFTMDSTTNDTTLWTSNSMFLGASNNYQLNAQSNINIGALGGDYKAYADSSNMYLTMTQATDTMTMYTLSNMFLSASNNLNLNAQSNVNIGALGGDFKAYSRGSNMYLTMAAATNNVDLFASNNLTVSVSNTSKTWVNTDYNLATKTGDITATANSSNMYMKMTASTNDISFFSSNNTVFSASNSVNIYALSNYTLSTSNGGIVMSANSSNMLFTMDGATNDVTLFSSNNTNIGVSNNYNLNVNCNIGISTVLGSYSLSANSSNMLLTMDSLTNDTTLFTSNNYQVSVSNNMDVSVKSNLNISTAKGDFNVYANSSNMFLTMNHTTNNLTMFASNNMTIGASNSYNLNAKSNILIGALNGAFKVYSDKSNMFLTMDNTTDNIAIFSSNNTTVSVSNNLSTYVQSNILISANYGSHSLYANSSNMSLIMDSISNDVSLYAASNINITADSNLTASIGSNVSLSANAGSLKLYASDSNMSIVMDATTLNTTQYTSNDMFISASNNYNLNVQSNINIGALGGDYKAYSDSSNMYLSMVKSTDTVTLYTLSNMFLSASNDFNLNAQSNINIGALGGDYKAYADSSNMYLTMAQATDTMTMYTLSNMFISASNNYNLNTRSNINIGALGGDVKVYSQGSNMYMTMIAATNNTTLYTANIMSVIASNNYTLDALSNVTINAARSNINIYASNTIQITASNNYNLNVNNNINVGALAGSLNQYADASNMYLTMNQVGDVVTLYTLSNMFLSASNDFNLNAQSNVNIGALGGDLKLYSQKSNMYLTMASATNNVDIFASNNLVVTASNSSTFNSLSNITVNAFTSNITVFASNTIAITSSNNVTLDTQSNININTMGGDFNVNANSSQMFLTMEAATNNTTLFTSNDMFTSASNNYNLNAQSNINIGALGGDYKAYADSSNMYLTMAQATDTMTLYTLSNMFISASNNYNLNAQSNINIGALGGDVKVYSQGSNMYMTMIAATNNTTLYTANIMSVIASNNYTLNALSNVTINAVRSNINIYASNTIAIIASNNLNINTNSNININTVGGDYNVSVNSSNMFLTMDATTNNTTLFTSNDMFVDASNNFSLNANSNVTLNSLNGSMDIFASSDLSLTADNSNMYINMAATGDVITAYSLSNISFSACNNMFLRSSSNISINTSNLNILSDGDISIVASNNITISGSNGVYLNFANVNVQTSNNQTFSAQSNIEFFITSASNDPNSPVFSVLGNQVLIRGDMVITGDITTSNVFSTTVIQESLKVQDTTIVLASTGSNFDPEDGPFDGPAVNSGAGISIDGVPSYYDSNIVSAYDKTLKWNYGAGTGINQLGTDAGLSNEPYWDFKGGALQLTQQSIIASGGSNIVQDVSFKFRIGSSNELEICKTYWTGSAYNTIRVARFGRVL